MDSWPSKAEREAFMEGWRQMRREYVELIRERPWIGEIRIKREAKEADED